MIGCSILMDGRRGESLVKRYARLIRAVFDSNGCSSARGGGRFAEIGSRGNPRGGFGYSESLIVRDRSLFEFELE